MTPPYLEIVGFPGVVCKIDAEGDVMRARLTLHAMARLDGTEGPGGLTLIGGKLAENLMRGAVAMGLKTVGVDLVKMFALGQSFVIAGGPSDGMHCDVIAINRLDETVVVRWREYERDETYSMQDIIEGLADDVWRVQ